MCGMSPLGSPVWDFVVDPALEENVPAQGIHFAEGRLQAWFKQKMNNDDVVLLVDHVGSDGYPSVASDIEEIRRFGRSARVQKNFTFEKLAGKLVYLASHHSRAIPQWETRASNVSAPSPELLSVFRFTQCKFFKTAENAGPDDVEKAYEKWVEHWSKCLFWTWPLAYRHHANEVTPDHKIACPSFTFDPLAVIVGADSVEIREHLFEAVDKFPLVGYLGGIYAIFPITNIEAIRYVPDGTSVEKAGIPVDIVEE